MLLTESQAMARDPWEWRRGLVVTCGVFDILHIGHLRLLEQARQLGQSLAVLVNSDRSARALRKGHDRPIVPALERQALVGALRPVDWAILFDDDTPARLIERMRPNVFVKGGDYHVDGLPEGAIVRALGGRVETVPFVGGRSTTAIVERIRG